MAQIDEKLKAIAKIRMAVDIDVAAHARIDNKAAEARISTKTVHMSAWAAPDNVNGDAPHWIYDEAIRYEDPILVSLNAHC